MTKNNQENSVMVRLMSFTVMILVALASSGCHRKRMTEIAIDPNLPTNEQRIAIEAANDWFDAVEETRMPIHIGPNRGNGYIGRGTEERCAPDKAGLGGGYTRLSYWKPAQVFLCPPHPSLSIRRTVLHELGHAFSGDDTHLGEGNVMGEFHKPDTVTELTADDIEYVAKSFRKRPLK